MPRHYVICGCVFFLPFFLSFGNPDTTVACQSPMKRKKLLEENRLCAMPGVLLARLLIIQIFQWTRSHSRAALSPRRFYCPFVVCLFVCLFSSMGKPGRFIPGKVSHCFYVPNGCNVANNTQLLFFFPFFFFLHNRWGQGWRRQKAS